MCAFIFERSSAPCDAELRFGAARGRCRRSQGAPASRLANCDVVKTQARSGCRRVFRLRTFAVAASELAAFDSDDACLLGTLSLNLAEPSAQNLSQKQLHQTKKLQNEKMKVKTKTAQKKTALQKTFKNGKDNFPHEKTWMHTPGLGSRMRSKHLHFYPLLRSTHVLLISKSICILLFQALCVCMFCCCTNCVSIYCVLQLLFCMMCLQFCVCNLFVFDNLFDAFFSTFHLFCFCFFRCFCIVCVCLFIS